MKMRFNQYKHSSSSQPASDSEASYRPRSRDRERLGRSVPSGAMRDRMDRSYDRHRDVDRHRKRRGRGGCGYSAVFRVLWNGRFDATQARECNGCNFPFVLSHCTEA